MNNKIGFIGCGNMGGALAYAVSKSVSGKSILLFDIDKSKADNLATETGASVASSATELIKSCKFVFLGIKPQFMESAVSPLVDTINTSDCIIVTMAAGLEIFFFEEYLKINRPIIRIMPNTPCKIGDGVILYAPSKMVSLADEAVFLDALSKCGLISKLEESKIDAATAVCGCGPAFACIFAEALADAAVELGIPRDKAIIYAAQMLKGSAQMIIDTPSPASLKDAVCSPGGSTIAGVHALEENGFRAATMAAVVAAYKRNIELKG